MFYFLDKIPVHNLQFWKHVVASAQHWVAQQRTRGSQIIERQDEMFGVYKDLIWAVTTSLPRSVWLLGREVVIARIVCCLVNQVIVLFIQSQNYFRTSHSTRQYSTTAHRTATPLSNSKEGYRRSRIWVICQRWPGNTQGFPARVGVSEERAECVPAPCQRSCLSRSCKKSDIPNWLARKINFNEKKAE